MSALPSEITLRSHGRPPATPGAMVGSFLKNRDLIWQMAKREVVGRYKGSALGLFWSFFNPLLMLAVYTFAFGYVFHARFPQQSRPDGAAGVFDFALYAFAGLILFSMFSEVVNRSPLSIVQSANYVKKVVFPLEILPFVYLTAALIHAGISALVLLLAASIFHGAIGWTVVLAPFTLIPLLLVILGLAWFLSSLGVYLRDVAQTMTLVSMMVMYLAPVFYSIDNIHNQTLRMVIHFNPLTVPLMAFRNTFLDGTIPPAAELAWLGGYFAVSLMIAWLGFAFFQRTKRGFADVI